MESHATFVALYEEFQTSSLQQRSKILSLTPSRLKQLYPGIADSFRYVCPVRFRQLWLATRRKWKQQQQQQQEKKVEDEEDLLLDASSGIQSASASASPPTPTRYNGNGAGFGFQNENALMEWAQEEIDMGDLHDLSGFVWYQKHFGPTERQSRSEPNHPHTPKHIRPAIAQTRENHSDRISNRIITVRTSPIAITNTKTHRRRTPLQEVTNKNKNSKTKNKKVNSMKEMVNNHVDSVEPATTTTMLPTTVTATTACSTLEESTKTNMMTQCNTNVLVLDSHLVSYKECIRNVDETTRKRLFAIHDLMHTMDFREELLPILKEHFQACSQVQQLQMMENFLSKQHQ